PRVMENTGEDRYFELIYQWVKSESPARMFFVRGYLEVLIAELIFRASKNRRPEISGGGLRTDEELTIEKLRQRIKKSNRRADGRIQVVMDYVSLHPTEKYTPARMAEIAGLSKQRFTHLFKEQTGKSPMVYIKELRLTIAARRLLVS